VLAVLALGVVAAAFAASDDTLEAVVFGLIAPLFFPAIAVSLTNSIYRNTVLRASTALSLVIAIAGGIIDFGIPVVMSLPTVLLAQGAGLIFQRRG
jgi:hypothetical protein